MADRPITGPLRVAILARATHPLHGVGGLERHVYDLVRHLVAQDVHVTLITRPATEPAAGPAPDPAARSTPAAPPAGADAAAEAAASTRGEGSHGPSGSLAPGRPAIVTPTREVSVVEEAADRFGLPRTHFRLLAVPYVTFPGAGRRGTTVVDRATAYPIFGWRVGRVAVKLVHRGEIDIVHALGASGLGYALARRRHEQTVPFVFNPQGLEEFGATDPKRARLKRVAYAPLQVAVRSCARAADLVLATDHALVPTVLRHLPVDASRVTVVPNAIDLTAIDRPRARAAAVELRARVGLSPDTRVLLSVGRLEENKGFHVAARAFGELLRREAGGADPPWVWVLVGEGPYRSAIERAAATEGLASRMIMTGRASDDELHAWYETAALFVHPTLYEGSSLVTLEAMGHARAVVATRAGGLPDKVRHGVNGWLVEPDRADLLADALADALHAGADLAGMGEASRALVMGDFAWPIVATRLIELYRQLMDGRGAPGERA